ncbi:MAG: peptidase [Gammaproteobacteria bacterium RIFCSPLOWO2_02_47_7]|nr:MAG: peptidase [Gammaproteobacteria bacterium RIFCSPLOWO2_02_47_7]
MTELNLLEKIIVWAIPVVFAITVHEVAHGWVANYLGDPTAKSLGRLTLNPIKHIDPIGTVVLPLILVYLGGFIFGWAKPVPVTWQNLRSPRRDMAIVAAAGPVANLIMMILWAVLAKVLLTIDQTPGPLLQFVLVMCSIGIIINIILMVLNLLPLLPLDGGRVVTSLLPPRLAMLYSRLEPFGLIVILVLLVTGVLANILMPVVSALEAVIYNLINS